MTKRFDPPTRRALRRARVRYNRRRRERRRGPIRVRWLPDYRWSQLGVVQWAYAGKRYLPVPRSQLAPAWFLPGTVMYGVQA